MCPRAVCAESRPKPKLSSGHIVKRPFAEHLNQARDVKEVDSRKISSRCSSFFSLFKQPSIRIFFLPELFRTFLSTFFSLLVFSLQLLFFTSYQALLRFVECYLAKSCWVIRKSSPRKVSAKAYRKSFFKTACSKVLPQKFFTQRSPQKCSLQKFEKCPKKR